MNYTYQELLNIRAKLNSHNPSARLDARQNFDALLDFTIRVIKQRNSDLEKIHSVLRDIIANQNP